MNRRCTILVAVVGALCLVAQRPASAQTGGTQQTGSSGLGTGTSGMSRASGSTAGAASTLSAAQGYGLDSRYTGSGFNRFTTGSSTMGQTTAGAGAATSGAFGQTANQSQTGGQNRFGNIGGMGGMSGMMGYGGMGGMGGMMGYGRNMSGGMGMQQTNQQKNSIRTHMRLGFDKPVQAVGTVNARFSGVVKRVLDRKDVGGGLVTVSMEGSTAVLTGSVASEHARGVIESLAMLEPGIGAVRNELLVSPGEPTRGTEPTSRTGDPRQ
jgi:hypothetical protein